MSFVRNTWYAACWSEDLLAGEPLAKTILCDPVVLWRSESGAPVALEDRCCHRHLPLSLGKVTGQTIQCGYHGLEFDPSGTCVKVPGQSRVPPEAAVRSWPVVEKHNMVWIWPGEPGAAREELVPDLWWLNDPGWVPSGGHLPLQADYRLLIDNLLDLSHVSYLHKNTIAGDPREATVPVSTTRRDDSIHVDRWMIDFEPPPMFVEAGGFEGNVDRWQLITWQAPSVVTLDIGCADTGTGASEGDRSRGISMWSNHIITPETETSTHYHWAFARNYKLDDPNVTELLAKGGLQTFMEDVVVLEAQQKAINDIGDRPVVDINIDNAPTQFRRILADKVAAEAGAVAAE